MVHASLSLACEHHAASDSGKPCSGYPCARGQDRPASPFHRAESDANVHLVKSALSTPRHNESHARRQGFPGSVAEAAALSPEDNDRLTDLHAHELSANTRNNYRVQWTGFVNWAQSRGFCALPAAPDVVAAYLAERFEKRQHKPATLRLAASAIGHFHRVAKLDNPSESGKVRSTLSGATRKAGLLQKQARGLTESDFDAIRKSAYRPRRSRGGHLETEETARRRGEVDIAIVSLMRDCLLRVSEAAAARHCDIEQMEDDTGRLLIRRSKTDQEGKSAKAFISRGTMAAIRCIRNGASQEDSVFGLRRNQISGRIKQAAKHAGLADGFSGHSPRVGMAIDLARYGIELPRLMVAGRWRSPMMPAHYTRNESVSRGAVAQYHAAREGRSRR